MVPLVALAPSGCSGPESRIKRIGRHLDAVGRALDDYGTVSVSSPLLVDVRKLDHDHNGFEFDLTTGPDDYYKSARTEVQGTFGSFSQRATDSSGGLQIRANLENLDTNRIRWDRFKRDEAAHRRNTALQDASALLGLVLPVIDPSLAFAQPESPPPDATDGGVSDAAAVAGAAANTVGEPEPEPLTPEQERTARTKAFIDALTNASKGLSVQDRPDIPEFEHDLPDIDPDVLPNNDLVEQLIQNQKFANFRQILADMEAEDPKVPNRSAILTAAGDSMVESIMKFLGKPVVPDDWRDKVVLMGVSMVSVAPGTRTNRDYEADVAVRVRLDYRPMRYEVWEKVRSSKYFDSLVDAFDSEIHKRELEFEDRIASAREQKETLLSEHGEDSKEVADWKNQMNRLIADRDEFLTRQHQLLDQRWQSFTDELENALDQTFKGDSRRPEPANQGAPGTKNGADKEAPAKPTIKILHADLVEQIPGEPVIFGLTVDHRGDVLVVPRSMYRTEHPVVSAATPMTEAHTFDLTSSIRNQQAFAFRLAIVVSGYGAEAQAQQLFKLIDRLEQDAQTRTPMNTVAAYSNAGSVFGYQIGPALRGLSDVIPSQRQGGISDTLGTAVQGRPAPGPDAVLQRQSFPVALFIGLNRHDLSLHIAYDRDSGKAYVVEPTLRFEQTTRWIPIRTSKFGKKPPKGISESERVEWAWNLGQAIQLADTARCEFDCDDGGCDPSALFRHKEFSDYVRTRAEIMRSQALIAQSWQTLPSELIVNPNYEPEDRPEAELVLPRTIELEAGEDGKNKEAKATVVIHGRNLREASIKLVPYNKNIQTVSKPLSKDAIAVELDIKTPDERRTVPYHFQLDFVRNNQPEHALSPPFQIIPAPAKTATPPKKDSKDIVLERTTTTVPGGGGAPSATSPQRTVSEKITLSPGIPADVVKQFVGGTDKRSEEANVSVNLNVDAVKKGIAEQKRP